MKRQAALSLGAAVLLSTLVPATAQEQPREVLPRVGLLSVASGESPSTSVLGSVVEDTIELALLQLGQYEFVPPEELASEAGENAGAGRGVRDPRGLAATDGLEFVLIQRLGSDGGESTVSLELYDAVNQRYGGTHTGTFRSSLDVFDAADEAILGALGELAGTTVAFGSLRLEVSGADRPYEVVLGEARYEGSPRVLSRLLTGRYPFEAVTEDGITVLRDSVTIAEGETTRISLSFPELFPEELRAFRATYRSEVEEAFGLLVPGISTPDLAIEGAEVLGGVDELLEAPEAPGLRGVPRGVQQIEALRRDAGTSGWVGAPARAYRQLSASELHERIPSIGRSTAGALATLAREITVPNKQPVRVDGEPSEWDHAEPFFLDPPADWIGRVGFADHTAQLMMLFELNEPNLLSGDLTNFTLVFSGAGGKELTLEFRGDQDTVSVGSSTWSVQGAYIDAGERVIELAVPKAAFERQFEPWEQLRVRLRAEPVSASGTLSSRDTGFQGALMPLLQ
ncbi:MAG: hypothetical protein ACLFPW_09310 [Spirochaetaceae bacterium]